MRPARDEIPWRPLAWAIGLLFTGSTCWRTCQTHLLAGQGGPAPREEGGERSVPLGSSSGVSSPLPCLRLDALCSWTGAVDHAGRHFLCGNGGTGLAGVHPGRLLLQVRGVVDEVGRGGRREGMARYVTCQRAVAAGRDVVLVTMACQGLVQARAGCSLGCGNVPAVAGSSCRMAYLIHTGKGYNSWEDFPAFQQWN